MARALKEVSRAKDNIEENLAWHDYGNDTLCRKGLWVGMQRTYQETVVIDYEHEPENLSVYWRIDGVYVTGIDGRFERFIGSPPVGILEPMIGLSHRLTLVSKAGNARTCLTVQPVYYDGISYGLQEGPTMRVCLSGSDPIEWPAHLLLEAEACENAVIARIKDLLQRRAWPPVWPREPDPLALIAQRLATLPGEQGIRFTALLDTIEKIDSKSEPDLSRLLDDELGRMVFLELAASSEAAPAG